MPIIESTYNPSFYFKNAHFNTIYKTLFHKSTINFKRERILTPDNDFLDLDFSTVNSNILVIAMHGLEGSSQSKYIISVVNYLNSNNIDCVAVNFRGCSGEDNNHLFSYNSGKTDDVGYIVQHIISNYNYKNIILLGYSMGGNITLKYLGESSFLPSEIKGAIGISVPCDLKGSSYALSSWQNSVYMNRFLKTLKEKTFLKLRKFPKNNIHKEKVLNAKNFQDFDDAVTAPLFGYKNAEDYWVKCSSKQFIPAIKKPTLLINALDDSFLSKSCFPLDEAKNHTYFNLETPRYGGHVGFNSFVFKKKIFWSENRILEFINHIIS
ncbi:MAG: alpha/beta fold hydrolase [Lutibacter sp.]|uniref:YheT family hydrolase n=1 Tax=Lutibacter sp. TaxID=1925666 RepID=UPI00385D689D